MGDKTTGWLLATTGRKKLQVVVLAVVQALHGASGVLYALLLRSVVDAAVAHEHSLFWRSLVLVATLVAAQLALRAVVRWLTELSHATFENLFKARLMRALLHGDYLRVSSVHSGEWLNRLTNDTVVVANGCVDIVPGLVGMVVKLVSALVMIVVLEPRFAAIVMPGGLLLVVFTWLFRRVLKRLHKDIQEADGHLRMLLQERMESLLMLRSFAAEDYTMRQVDDLMDGHRDARMRRNHFSNLCNIGFGAAMNGMYLLGVGWCGYGILTGTISFGTLTAITQLISQVQMPFANITGYLPRYFALLASAERLMEAEELVSQDVESLPLADIHRLYDRDIAAFGLRNCDFAYLPTSSDVAGVVARDSKEGMPAVLRGITFEVRHGETVALVGRSGCGKSTALKLLMCVFEPDAGERYYRDAAGVTHALTSAHRRLFAYVPQGNVLMSGTVREVVSLACPEAAGDDERLAFALRTACADEFVRELPDGMDTLLGERGCGLSEGQMQRLAVARALFSGSPVLLLDEATSALDAATEERLLRNLHALGGLTTVVVTHRTAALAACERVLTFGEGSVTEQ